MQTDDDDVVGECSARQSGASAARHEGNALVSQESNY
jgi:hypothetical protein